MTPVHAVLLIPEAGDPHGLLAEGPCGARPPMAVRAMLGCGQLPWSAADGAYWANRTVARVQGHAGLLYQHALVIAWGGEVVAAGCDWAQEAILPEREGGWVHAHWFRACVKAHLNPSGFLSEYASRLAADPRWTVVLLDADGREITNTAQM